MNELAWVNSQAYNRSVVSCKSYIQNCWGGRVTNKNKNSLVLVHSSSKTKDKDLCRDVSIQMLVTVSN
eukprot:11365616-Ditylum_brightwellii.AAC.1